MNALRLPIPIKTEVFEVPKTSVYYPQVIWPLNIYIQNHINQAIYQDVTRLFKKVYNQGYYVPGRTEFTGNYEIKNNQRGILSLTLSNFAYMFPMAHPVDNLTSLTTDIRTGKIYQLQDLFLPNSNYVARISELVNIQITERGMEVFEGFTGIRPDQDYYIADKCLVIFFQRYEIGPRPLGYPMFPIPIYQLEDIIRPDGPLGIMIYDD